MDSDASGLKDYCPSALLKAVKEASPVDLFIISFLILPFVFNAWIGILDDLQATHYEKVISFFTMVVFYTIAVGLLLAGSTRRRRYETAKDMILTCLQQQNSTALSFERIRELINVSYSDEFLRKVGQSFPGQIRLARIKGGKAGIAHVVEESLEGE